MAKFPVEISDDEGIADAVNYLLSGPAGLGQNFAGFSAYTPAYLTGNYRPPFTDQALADIYVAPIALSTSEMLNDRTFKFTFAATQSAPPFVSGNPISVSGTSDSWYNDSYGPIGVTECTVDYVTVVTRSPLPLNPPATGGTVEYNLMLPDPPPVDSPGWNSTDCNAKVTVTGGTDRVFISAQLNSLISYQGSGNMTYSVAINRYKGFINNDPVNPEYRFLLDQTISEKSYSLTGLSGPATLADIETIFTTVIDQPPPAYYWYILEVRYATNDSGLYVTSNEFDLRSLSAQVVKQ